MPKDNVTDPKQVASIAQQIVKLLTDENSETRQRAVNAALTILGEVVIANANSSAKVTEFDKEDQTSVTTFFNRGEKLKPSDTAFLCAAFHYSQFGSAAFSLDEIRAIAADAGEVIPDRVDMTLKNASKNGKRFFQLVGKNFFKPTAGGALFFKDRWNVKPGKKSKMSKEVK